MPGPLSYTPSLPKAPEFNNADPEDIFVVPFSLNGDGVTFGMNVNGSVTPQQFRVVVPADYALAVQTVEFHIVDAGIGVETFGGIAALTNGLLFHIHDVDGSYLVQIIQDQPIKANFEFAHFVGMNFELTPGGGTQDFLRVVWPLQAALGFRPYLQEGQYFALHIRDNLTGLTHFEGSVSGRLSKIR